MSTISELLIKSYDRRKVLTFTYLFSVVFFLFTVSPVFAADSVVINEFSSGTTSDWAEIYNNGTENVDLVNYKLRDSETYNKDLSGNLAPGQFVSFNLSNRLNNSGDIIRLIQIVDGAETILEQIAYGDAG